MNWSKWEKSLVGKSATATSRGLTQYHACGTILENNGNLSLCVQSTLSLLLPSLPPCIPPPVFYLSISLESGSSLSLSHILFYSLCLSSDMLLLFLPVYLVVRSPSPSEMNGKPWARPSYQDQAAAEHTQDKCTAFHQEPQQQHPDKLCLDSFWSEVETIRSQDSGYIDLDTDSASRDSRHSEGKHRDTGLVSVSQLMTSIGLLLWCEQWKSVVIWLPVVFVASCVLLNHVCLLYMERQYYVQYCNVLSL